MEAATRALISVVALVGCGRIGFDAAAHAGVADAPGDVACTFSDWGAPERLGSIATAANDWEPAFHPGGLALAYGTKSGTDGVVSIATRPSATDAFVPKVKVPHTAYEYGPAWSADGATLYFSRATMTSVSLVAMDYASGAISNERVIASPQGAASISIDAAGLELFFTVNVVANDYDLGHATRATTASAWVTDSLLDGFNRPVLAEGWSFWDEPRQALYFERDRADQSSTDIVMTTRTAPGQPFATPIPVLLDAGDPDLMPDGLTMVFASPGPVDADVFTTTRTLVCE